MKFSKALRKASTQAYRDDDMDRHDFATVWFCSFSRRRKVLQAMREVEKMVFSLAIAAGVIPPESTAEGFDWEQLIAFIRTILEIIIPFLIMIL